MALYTQPCVTQRHKLGFLLCAQYSLFHILSVCTLANAVSLFIIFYKTYLTNNQDLSGQNRSYILCAMTAYTTKYLLTGDYYYDMLLWLITVLEKIMEFLMNVTLDQSQITSFVDQYDKLQQNIEQLKTDHSGVIHPELFGVIKKINLKHVKFSDIGIVLDSIYSSSCNTILRNNANACQLLLNGRVCKSNITDPFSVHTIMRYAFQD